MGKHESICDECDFRSEQMGSVHKHKQFKHGGIWDPCNSCKYNTTIAGNLLMH